MSVWRQLARGLRALGDRRGADQDVADEVQHYLDETAAAHRARGLSPEDALRAARVELGGVRNVREEVRAYGWENVVETVLADLRYAARRLRAAPGFTSVAVLTLALGIGATTAIFSAVNPILFESLPYPNPHRLVAIVERYRNGNRGDGTFGMYRGLSERARSLDGIAVLKGWQPTTTGTDQPERLDGQRVSAGYFRVLGVSPMAGRDFQPADDEPNGPRVVILSDALWRRRFHADRAIVGQTIRLDDDPFLVIGVMPADFENVLAPSAQLWAPLQYSMSEGRTWGHHLRTVARLHAGASLDRAALDVDAAGHAVLAEQHPDTYRTDVVFDVTSLQADLTRGVRPALLAVLGAVTLVLVIACVNVTNLLLARGVHRRGELALRAALGAARGRLVRQLLTESVLLAAAGGALGMAVAKVGVRALVALSPSGLPRIAAIRVDGVAFAFGLAITTLIGLVLGLTPALQATHSDPSHDLQLTSRRASSGNRRTRSALVVAEVALALMLLVGSGLLLRSIRRLFAVPVGFDSAQLLTMQVQTASHRFDADSARIRFFSDALDAVRRVPGVTAAALTSQLPLSGDMDQYGARFSATATQAADRYAVFRYAVTPGYLEIMGIPIVQGRTLDEHDRGGAPLVALISESLARARFHGESPIGKLVRVGGADNSPPFTIVGVVGDVKQMSLALGASDAVYTATTQWHWADNVLSLVVHVRGDAGVIAPAVRNAIWSVDKDQPVVRVATMSDLVAASAAERHFALILFEAFALSALVLAAAGIYGVLAGSVAERTREIGVRSALGASRGDILALIVRQGMILMAAGIVIGLAGAVAASRAIATLLFGVSPLDPVTYIGVIALLAGVSLIACGIPAWRAARVDPTTALRAE